MKLSFIQVAGVIGAADCVLVPMLFTSSIQQPFFPLPGLYFLEISMLGLLGLVSAVRDQASPPAGWRLAPWMSAGVLLAFNILGAWTIGFFLFPGTLAFLGVGFWLANREPLKIWQGLGVFFISAIAQANVILALIRILR